MTALATLTEKESLSSAYCDLYKDVHGHRPRWYNFDTVSLEQLQADYDSLYEESQVVWAEEKAQEERHVEEFKALVARTIQHGAKDEQTALRWLTQGETFYTGQCVEQFVWNAGILYTDYGREIINKLMGIVV